MNKQRMIGLALPAVWVLLVCFGYESSQGLNDQLSETVRGQYIDST